MELKEIAVVSGKPGLFKIVKPAVNGVILEALDGTSARFIAGTSTKVSVLGEISIYTTSGNNVPLEEVFRTIYTKHSKQLSIGSKSTDAELRSFFDTIVPDHDKQRVYISDIKKVANWYTLLLNAGFGELFAKQPESAESEPKKEKKGKKEVENTETPTETTAPKKEKKETKAAKATKQEDEAPVVEKKASKSPAAKKTK